ncbi:MAG: dTMP kinase [Candidatus Levybacteria bacterium]|nr:dTMP kinase [Candidatus Levybacteria bacterium]
MTYHIDFDIDLRRNPYPGRYIVIEGIDGSGKSTQVQRVKEALAKRGVTVLETAEPNTHDAIGVLIRDVLAAKVKIPSVAIQYLFSANRATTHQEIIHPALQEGKTVISHRCFWSAVAYGMVDRADAVKDEAGNQILIAQSILSMYHQFIFPDSTFYLRVPVNTALSRIGSMAKDKEIYEKREKLEKIAKGYEWLLQKFSNEFVVIDGEGDVEEITARIVERINRS